MYTRYVRITEVDITNDTSKATNMYRWRTCKAGGTPKVRALSYRFTVGVF